MAKYGEYVEVKFDWCRHRTEKAFQMVVWGEDDEDKYHWIPESVIDPEELPEVGEQPVTTMVEEWFALQEGLI